jgi:hypothetical protein
MKSEATVINDDNGIIIIQSITDSTGQEEDIVYVIAPGIAEAQITRANVYENYPHLTDEDIICVFPGQAFYPILSSLLNIGSMLAKGQLPEELVEEIYQMFINAWI